MSKPILVGYEPTTLDQAPVRFGVAAARFTRAPLIIASVSHGSDALDRLGGGKADENLADDAREALGDIKAALEAEGVRVECRDLKGVSAPRALHEAAEAEDAGLLVVGSRHEGAHGRVVPGSTVDRLLHGAPCLIAVVPQGWEEGRGLDAIGVGFVATDEGDEALRCAYELARRAVATLVVTTVVKAALPAEETLPGMVVPTPEAIAEVESEHRRTAEHELRAALDRLDGDVPVEAEVVVARDPAEVLITLSERVDLLVCGSRGYGPLRAVVLGGVARRVSTEARCPVLVVPRGVRASVEALMAERAVPAAG
jgi:nucleotide-binding universal stress UspA family protein